MLLQHSLVFFLEHFLTQCVSFPTPNSLPGQQGRDFPSSRGLELGKLRGVFKANDESEPWAAMNQKVSSLVGSGRNGLSCSARY